MTIENDQVIVQCTRCDVSVTLPVVLPEPALVTIHDGQMRLSLEPLFGWFFTLDTGWVCPAHVQGDANPPEGVKGEQDPPSDVRTF